MGNIIFITGGARSGKSAFAENLLAGVDDVLYLATAVACDDEMAERIRLHRERRNPLWRTVEGYRGLGAVLSAAHETHNAALLDCVTILVTNLMFENTNINWDAVSASAAAEIESDIHAEIDLLLDSAAAFDGQVVMVSNEIGMGIVPGTPLSRHFRDIAGRVNQRIAARSDEAYLLVSGIALKIKGGA